MHLNAPVGPRTDFYNFLSPCSCSNKQSTPLQREEEEAAAKLTCYNCCHLHTRKISALLIGIRVFYKMAQQMQCADENDADSDAAKTLQAERRLSRTGHLTHTLPRQ